MERPSFLRDLCVLIGILPIERPKIVRRCDNGHLQILGENEKRENKRDTEKLFELLLD